MSDLDAIRARHVPTAGTSSIERGGLPNASCAKCGGYWPCDTAIVLAALDAAETSLRTGVAVHAELKVRLDAALMERTNAERGEQAALARERRLREALLSEDEIAHGEAVTQKQNGDYERLGMCAYCDDVWPCRTQQGIDRALAETPEAGS